MIKALNPKEPDTLSLYIHIPFCKTICVYCGFLTFANKNGKIPKYINALKREIKKKSTPYKMRNVVSIYFGGGTPSLLDAGQIDEILETIHKDFKVMENAEITIEGNPESISPEKLAKYRKIGINRLSIGIQTLNDKCLWKIARFHNQKTALKSIESIKEVGFSNFGLDFIIGLPYQTPAIFKKELLQILKFNPPHLSFYFLSHDTEKVNLLLPDCPSESTQITMYKYLVKKLKENDYVHYEVSNYAKTGFECRHNLRYWHQQEYLGLGLGAHSYIKRRCTENEKDFERYLANPLAFSDSFDIDDETDRMEYIMLHLRTHEGLDLGQYENKFGHSAKIIKDARKHIKSGSLTYKNNRIMPTDKGFLIIDRITTDLL